MPSQGSVQQHDMYQLRDESKDSPLVIAASGDEELDDVEPALVLPGSPCSTFQTSVS